MTPQDTAIPSMRQLRLSDTDAVWACPLLRGASVAIRPSLREAEAFWRAAVAAGACTLFQSYEWLSAWQETVGRCEGVMPCIVEVSGADGTPLLLLPLGIYRGAHGRALQFLGGYSTDYNAPVIDRRLAAGIEPGDARQLWAVILDLLPSVDLVWLQRLPLTVDGVPNPLGALPNLRHAQDAYAATLPATYEAFAKARSTQFFSQNRRKRRKLEGAGAVEIVLAEEAAERAEIVRFLLDHKSRWQVASGLPNTLGAPAQRALYERLTEGRFAEGGVLVAGLRVDGEWVAALWGTIFRGSFAMILTTYREDWAPFSVGRLLMERVIQACIARGDLTLFDLTVGEEGYKAHWSDRTTPLYEILAARSLRGRLYLVARSLHRRWKRVDPRAKRAERVAPADTGRA